MCKSVKLSGENHNFSLVDFRPAHILNANFLGSVLRSDGKQSITMGFKRAPTE